VADLVRFVFSAGGILCAVLIGCAWALARPRSSAPRRFILFVTLTYALAAIYPLSSGVARLWQGSYLPFSVADVPTGSTAIVILGSGSFTARDWNEDGFSILDPAGANRVAEAVRVYKLVQPSWIISSGGRFVGDPNAPAGETVRATLIQLGIPPSRILIQTESLNTHDEAVIVARMLKPLRVRHVVLVTTDVHMRRTLGTFRAEGIEGTPAIARRPRRLVPWRLYLLPSTAGLDQTEAMAHEIFGVAYYKLRGWYRA
jgi:uncharacterized SAM-binding protein YcdF (DUF218 family)